MTNTLHAHVRTYSVDCDGPISRSWVETMNDDEIAESQKSVNDFSDIHFMNRVFVNRCGPFAVRHMSVTIEDGRVEWDETTEEGGTTGLIEWCEDPHCTTDERTYRDHRAESMGY